MRKILWEKASENGTITLVLVGCSDATDPMIDPNNNHELQVELDGVMFLTLSENELHELVKLCEAN